MTLESRGGVLALTSSSSWASARSSPARWTSARMRRAARPRTSRALPSRLMARHRLPRRTSSLFPAGRSARGTCRGSCSRAEAEPVRLGLARPRDEASGPAGRILDGDDHRLERTSWPSLLRSSKNTRCPAAASDRAPRRAAACRRPRRAAARGAAGGSVGASSAGAPAVELERGEAAMPSSSAAVAPIARSCTRGWPARATGTAEGRRRWPPAKSSSRSASSSIAATTASAPLGGRSSALLRHQRPSHEAIDARRHRPALRLSRRRAGRPSRASRTS